MAASPTLATARTTVVGGRHFTSVDLAGLLLGRPTPHQLARLRDQRTLLGLRIVRRGYAYPAFQIDEERRRIDPRVAKVNQLVLARMTPEEAAMWWLQSTSDHAAPADLLASDGYESVLALLAGA